MMINYPSILILLSSFAVAVYGTSVPLTLLTDSKARCMDGTLSGYYYQASTRSSDANKWVIHLQGGGECASKDACYGELSSNLGSSKYFDSSMGLWFLNYDNVNVNKDFGGANHVHVPYCSGDLHSGTVTSPSEETWDLYFSGHLIFEAVIDEMLAKYNLGSATDVILSGDSAGGIGVWMNLDYLKDRLSAINPSVRVVGAPIAGFYFYANEPYTGPDHTYSSLANFSESGMATAYSLWHSYVDQTCLQDRLKNSPPDPHACTLAAYSYPYIEADTFVFEAQTDQVVLEAHDWVPSAPTLCNNPELQYVASWRDEMLQHLTDLKILDLTSSKSGAFVPACYTHTGFSSSGPFITPSSSSTKLQYYDAFGNWYFNRTESSQYKLYDVCQKIDDVNTIDAKKNIFCNPTCSSYPC